jgi:ankyrin repeat protein
MSRRLTPDLTLEHLKKEAKRWLKALRERDPEARTRFERAVPSRPGGPTLRDVQFALAREFDLPGWVDLKLALSTRATTREINVTPTPADVSRFLDNACPDHHVRGGGDHVRAEHTALRLLERYPEIAGANFYTAVVCGDLDAVKRALDEDPGWATRTSGEPGTGRTDVGGEGDLLKRDWGSKGWQPLSYLCFTRLSLPAASDDAVAIARALLDHGADPNVYFMAGSSHYTPLVGAIGEGEESRPPHPQRDALVELLLSRGGNPYDQQVLYNIGFNGNVLWFLETIYAHSLRTGRTADWTDPEWPMLDMGGYGLGARWHLSHAIEHDDVKLAEWCLTHGANPNAQAPRRSRDQRSLYDIAVSRGRSEIATLLASHGASRSPISVSPMQRLVAACRRSDLKAIREEIAASPEFVQSAEPLFAAAQYNRRDAAELLLDLGTSPDIESRDGERALHIAAYHDSSDVAELLISRGATVDPIGRKYDNTPLGGAMHCRSRKMIALLSRSSRSAWEVGYAGNVERLRELLTEKPERARATGDGETLLMWLPPHDEATALQVATLLLDNGADPRVRDPRGMTAADRAERNAMYEVSAFLRERE